ncbi:hypothetical protein CEXT_755231 [Caerostris extrusa]|uniref:Uncharacterized protein n=1 Tax=Caerostris extrusa TaxID=172846 RepID=A0AAV4Y6C4_CAEEX|nr:hypothetical protein CEXT_755231 [Caerostris extrusa]
MVPNGFNEDSSGQVPPYYFEKLSPEFIASDLKQEKRFHNFPEEEKVVKNFPTGSSADVQLVLLENFRRLASGLSRLWLLQGCRAKAITFHPAIVFVGNLVPSVGKFVTRKDRSGNNSVR